MIIIAMETNHLNMLQDKDIKKIQELKYFQPFQGVEDKRRPFPVQMVKDSGI